MKNALALVSVSVLFFACGKKPTSDFSWTPVNPVAGEEVQFINESENAKSYSWNLGNMKISKEKSPKNSYDQPGNYIIDLTASSGLKSDEKTLTITVK